MVNPKPIVLAMLGFLLAATVISLGRWLFVNLSYNKYEDSIQSESPGGKYIASGYHLIGGATTTNSTIVEIRQKDQKKEVGDNGLLFIVDNLGSYEISWKNDHELLIRYTPGPIYFQKFVWKDVVISYLPR